MPVGDDRRSRANRALDGANFFLADVRDGLGPYLAIYLLTEQKWDEARIGLVMWVATVAGIVAQTPVGVVLALPLAVSRHRGRRVWRVVFGFEEVCEHMIKNEQV